MGALRRGQLQPVPGLLRLMAARQTIEPAQLQLRPAISGTRRLAQQLQADAAVAPAPKQERVQLHIALDLDVCQGHAVCVNEAPEVFYLDDETGKVAVHTDRPDPKHNDAVRAAADYCPQRTIQLEEEALPQEALSQDEASLPSGCPVAH